MLLGLWDQAHYVYDRYVKRALPDLTPEQLVRASGCVHRVAVDRGVVVVHQGDSADRFFIVSKGSVEVVRETRRGGRPAVSLAPGLLPNLDSSAASATPRRSGPLKTASCW